MSNVIVTIKRHGHHNLPAGLVVEVMREIDAETVFIKTAQVSKAIPKSDLKYTKGNK
ncbi:hypothetical protein [Psychromonas sp. psych-6C06]|uniref:hypothetical protein n=1 Tax=Psychromonas sp. psych-6C06 TaxID=2058089 RepID=UPI00187C86F6|nr:hypothetical protein [Psychromonas sp. psych-6C06]